MNDDQDIMKKLLNKYKSKLDSKLTGAKKEKFSAAKASSAPVRSREYEEFRKEYLPKHMGWYEKACNGVEKALKIKPSPKYEKQYLEDIRITHLKVTPTGIYSFAMTVPLLIGLLLCLLSLVAGSLFFSLFFLIFGLAGMMGFLKYPSFLSNGWRMKASNQMVLCIFYVVTYMRHTSNLEQALRFASDHIEPPLALDLRRVIWNIETEKYESVKESLDIYLDGWKEYNMEFVEAFHLIEGSLVESSEQRRVELLDKSLDVILQETYEKMLHFAHNLKSPMTMLHMLGIVLPILGLVILPLVVSFMEGVSWIHISMLYNVILPVSVFFLGKTIISKRPTGYGETDMSNNPIVQKYKFVHFNMGKKEYLLSPKMISGFFIVLFIIIGLIPLIIHAISPTFDASVMIANNEVSFLGYRASVKSEDTMLGPFGLGASVFSLAFPLAIGIGLGLYHRLKSKHIIKIRNQAKKLENEFASALFQLATRLGDGLPAEIAFSKVSETIGETSVSGLFFRAVSKNIMRLGMSVDDAIFHQKYGALVQYPSSLIESSMKVLVESAKKGPVIAAQSLMNVSRYIKEMHAVNERLKDLMADTIASMKSQIAFLTPAISGIVVGITAMITTIMGKLGVQITKLKTQTAVSATGSAGLAMMFGDGLPTYFFQFVVGLYVVQLVFLLSMLVNNIENGADKVGEHDILGKNLLKSTVLYCVLAMIMIVMFDIIAGSILSKTQ
jgi:Flp pilus assembly protein TadB